MTQIRSSLYESVQTIEMTAVETRNALSLEFQQEVLKALASGLAQQARVVVLKGTKEAFSSGYNLGTKGRQDYAADNDIFYDRDRLTEFTAFMSKVRSHPIPVISQVSGYCVAGGTDLMLSTDIALAADNARIGMPNVRGLGISLLSTLWPLYVGPMRTKLMMFTGDLISGAQAAQWGLVAAAVPEAELEDAVNSLATRIAQVPSSLLRATKLASNRAFDRIGHSELLNDAVGIDTMVHFTDPIIEFWKLAREDGMKAALRERDVRFQGPDFTGILGLDAGKETG